jgi:hypothetical protein
MKKLHVVRLAPEEREALERVAERERVSGEKRGSWLNVAEIFFSALSIQCLNRRIGNITELRSRIAAWCAARSGGKVTWRFTSSAQQLSSRCKLEQNKAPLAPASERYSILWSRGGS